MAKQNIFSYFTIACITKHLKMNEENNEKKNFSKSHLEINMNCATFLKWEKMKIPALNIKLKLVDIACVSSLQSMFCQKLLALNCLM